MGTFSTTVTDLTIVVCLLVGLVAFQRADSDADRSHSQGSHFLKIEASHERRGAGFSEDRRSDHEAESEEIDKCSEIFLEDKWQMLSKFFDLNHDKIINWKDMIIQGNIFSAMYNLEGCEKNSVNSKLYEFWSCITFNKFNEGLSSDIFVKQITQSYVQDKTNTTQQLRKCVETMVDLLDHDNNGFLVVDELATFYKSVNQGNNKMIEDRYKQMCPVSQKCCPIQNATDSWAEVLIGIDESAYDAITEVWENAGMPLDDLV